MLQGLADRPIDWISNLGHGAYLVIFVAVCLESAALLGFLVPGEMLVLLGGFLASQGVLDLVDLLLLVMVAAIIGDSVGYELGRCLGRAWLLRAGRWVGLGEAHLQRVDDFFDRHGGKTVFYARFSAFFRIMVPFVAGAVRLRYLHFLLYNALGSVVWSTVVVLLGYLAGASWSVVHRWIGRAGAVVGGIFLLVLVWAWLWRWLIRNETQVKRWRKTLASWPCTIAIRRRFGPALGFLRARLTPGEYLGLELTVGVVAFLAAAWLFGWIVRGVMTDRPIAELDRQVAVWFRVHSHPRLTLGMSLIGVLGGPVVLGGLASLVAAWLAIRRKSHWFWAFVLVMAGGTMLNAVSKLVFHQVRPHLQDPWTLLSEWGFPAGRINASVLLYGFLAMAAAWLLPGWRRGVSIVLCTALLIVLIGFSSVYLGIHYLSSVLAGAAEGAAWLVLCLTALATWRRRSP